MNKVQLYIDETKGKDFFIHACIFSNPNNCIAFENDIKNLIIENRNIVGKDFKGFHARDLNKKNWNKLSPIYERIIQLIFINSLDIHIYLESKNKYDKNSKTLRNWLKNNLEDTDNKNKVRQTFYDIAPKDFPVLYNRFDMLYIFLIHKNKFCENCEFEIYPDSSGKVLDYKQEKIEFTHSSQKIRKSLNFYDSFHILANAFIETFDEIGLTPNNNQKVTKFSPTNDIDCFLIQACDILANFTYHHLNFIFGNNNPNSKLKSELYSRYIPIKKDNEILRDSFSILNGELHCINKDMKININK